MKYWLLLLYLFASTLSWSENTYYRFRVYLKDKGNQIYHIHQPEAFLSEAALARRNQQHIPISESDLPISAAYKQQLTNSGCTLITESRWLSTVVVEYPDSSLCVVYGKVNTFPGKIRQVQKLYPQTLNLFVIHTAMRRNKSA